MCVRVCHGWPDYGGFWPFSSFHVCARFWVNECLCVLGGRIMSGFGHLASCKCARFGVNVYVCVFVCHGWPDYERFWPFCFVQVFEVWGQCLCVFVCVMGGRTMRGSGGFV